MKKKTKSVSKNDFQRDDPKLTTLEEMQLYCAAHPGSPAAVRRPQLSTWGDLWIALLGPSVERGIVGIGPSVKAALRAFDAQYLGFLRANADARDEKSQFNLSRAARIQPCSY
jgi:hypothetical protein